MLNLKGYSNQKKINKSQFIDIIRAYDEANKRSVIIKYASIEPESARFILNLKNEYEFMKSLESEYVIHAYSFEKLDNGFALILEDGGISLKEYVQSRKSLSIEEFLILAEKMTEILSFLHRNRIVHKDIKPTNFVINTQSNHIKIIDFGISTRLSREEVGFKSPNILEGSLPYISPEQTGRINKMIDYRSDFYSLGISFYELLTGSLPFTSNDPVELVYSHITRHPERISKINKEIPEELSDIVEKLISKDSEQRYQSGLGLKYDLTWVRENTFKNNEISHRDPFIPGSKDVSDIFQIPQKLYGREKEVDKLLSIFDRVTKGQSQLLLVTGYAGIGKSAFINETHKPITERKGYFLNGKFDQFQRNIPFRAIVQAFRELIDFLLSETENNLNKWKRRLNRALGANARVIIDMIPELEMVIGEQSPVPELGPIENQNRFNLTFQNFISVFAREEHPVVLFIDDLQWADTPSLNLIKLLMTENDSRNLLIIGAYRDNEIDLAHPLAISIDEIKKSGKEIETIHLGPLTKEDIKALISDAFKMDGKSQNLADLMLAKTGGNPFFLSELLKKFYKEELINFNYDNSEWEWDEKKIFSYGITDNVIDLMIDNLKKLPQDTIHTLSLASCLGGKFNVEILSVISEKPISDIASLLIPAVEEGMLIPEGGDLELRNIVGIHATSLSKNQEIIVRFQHDRVQQAAYSLIDETKKKEIHLKTGQLLLQNTSKDKQDEYLFEILGHLNLGSDLIVEENEKIELIQLNLRAVKKAKSNTAYKAALDLLRKAVSIANSFNISPSQNIWTTHYSIALDLYTELSELEYLNANFEEAEKCFKLVLNKSKNIHERMKIWEIQMAYYTTHNRFREAIDISYEALNEMGEPLPRDNFDPVPEIIKSKQLLSNRNIEDLDNFLLQDENIRLVARMLSMSITPSYLFQPALVTILILRLVNLTLEFGMNEYAPFALCMYSGLILGCTLGEYELGYKIGKITLDIVEKRTTLTQKLKHILHFPYLLIIGEFMRKIVNPIF